MSTQLHDLATERADRAITPTCPGCAAPSSVRASHHPSGAWLLTCGECDWYVVVPPAGRDDAWIPEPSGSDPDPAVRPSSRAAPAPDGVPGSDLRP